MNPSELQALHNIALALGGIATSLHYIGVGLGQLPIMLLIAAWINRKD